MSVLACDRSDCDEIMCHLMVLENRYYVCGACHSELMEWRQTWPESTKPHEVRGLIEEFMISSKGSYLPVSDTTREDTEAEFKRLTTRASEAP